MHIHKHEITNDKKRWHRVWQEQWQNRNITSVLRVKIPIIDFETTVLHHHRGRRRRWCAAYVADHWKRVFCKIRARLHCVYIPPDHSSHFTSTFAPRAIYRIYRNTLSISTNIAALSTAPDQVYTTHRAVPTSQIAQNIENIDRRNIADTSQLDALTCSDHAREVDDIHALTASKCINYIVLSYPSPFPAFATCFSRRQSTLSVYSLFWIFRLQYILLVILLVTHCFPLFLKVALLRVTFVYKRVYLT